MHAHGQRGKERKRKSQTVSVLSVQPDLGGGMGDCSISQLQQKPRVGTQPTEPPRQGHLGDSYLYYWLIFPKARLPPKNFKESGKSESNKCLYTASCD